MIKRAIMFAVLVRLATGYSAAPQTPQQREVLYAMSAFWAQVGIAANQLARRLQQLAEAG